MPDALGGLHLSLQHKSFTSSITEFHLIRSFSSPYRSGCFYYKTVSETWICRRKSCRYSNKLPFILKIHNSLSNPRSNQVIQLDQLGKEPQLFAILRRTVIIPKQWLRLDPKFHHSYWYSVRSHNRFLVNLIWWTSGINL